MTSVLWFHAQTALGHVCKTGFSHPPQVGASELVGVLPNRQGVRERSGQLLTLLFYRQSVVRWGYIVVANSSLQCPWFILFLQLKQGFSICIEAETCWFLWEMIYPGCKSKFQNPSLMVRRVSHLNGHHLQSCAAVPQKCVSSIVTKWKPTPKRTYWPRQGRKFEVDSMMSKIANRNQSANFLSQNGRLRVCDDGFLATNHISTWSKDR